VNPAIPMVEIDDFSGTPGNDMDISKIMDMI
jgi:hypothetical protein